MALPYEQVGEEFEADGGFIDHENIELTSNHNMGGRTSGGGVDQEVNINLKLKKIHVYICGALSVCIFFLLLISGGKSDSADPTTNPPVMIGNVDQLVPTPSNVQAPTTSTNPPVAPPVASGSDSSDFSDEKIQNVYIPEIRKYMKIIDDYYAGFNEPHKAWGRWDKTRDSPFTVKGLDYIASAFARRIVRKQTFLIGVIGSSVAAGHDNCNLDSYESQLETFMKPLVKFLGFDIKINNAGEGGKCTDNHNNQVWCLGRNAGDDIDLAHYSWTYFEGKEAGVLARESVFRWALMMKNRPAVHFFRTGSKEGQCEKSHGIPENWETYGDYGYNGLCLSNALERSGLYGGKVWGKVGDGMHNITRYGALLTDPARKSGQGVVWRNWHPGPLGFQLISDTFAYGYFKAIIRAYELISEARKKNKNLLDEFPDSPGGLPASTFPPALNCLNMDVKEVCDVLPSCINYERPHFGGTGGITEIGVNDANYPFPELVGTLPALKETLDGSIGNIKMIPAVERNIKECHHLDMCVFMEKPDVNKALPMAYKLDGDRFTVGTIVVCCSTLRKTGNNDPLASIRDNMEFTIDGEVMDKSKFVSFDASKKCAFIQQKHPKPYNKPFSVLSFTINEGINMKFSKLIIA